MEKADQKIELAWQTKLLGKWLRLVRLDRGYSMDKLAEASGVIKSEIYRVEIGEQECRIETLVELCRALGVTVGWVLDRVIFFDGGGFIPALSHDPATWDVLLRVGKFDDGIQEHLVEGMSSACALAAILLISSDPRSRVLSEDFPHEQWKEKFLAFADRVAEMGGDSLDRAAILHNLLELPATELLNQKLMAEKALLAMAQHYLSPKRKKFGFAWCPWFPRFPRQLNQAEK
jgi:transcriptional regulator with XRE-family HTH domain